MAHSLQLLAEKYSQIKKTVQHAESRTLPKYPESEYSHPQFRVLPRYSQEDKKEEVNTEEACLELI